MPNQNDPMKPPGQAGGTTPAPGTPSSGDKGGTQKDGGGTREEPSGGASRPPQESRAMRSWHELWGPPVLGTLLHRPAG